MKLDKNSRSLGIKMLLECSSELREEDCPRLKRRTGAPQLVPKLAFADVDSDYYRTEDEGATLKITSGPGYRVSLTMVLRDPLYCALGTTEGFGLGGPTGLPWLG